MAMAGDQAQSRGARPASPTDGPCRLLLAARAERADATPQAPPGVHCDLIVTAPDSVPTALAEVDRLVRAHQDETVLVVAAPPVVAAVLARLTRACADRFVILPGGVSFAEVGPDGAGVLHLHNWGVDPQSLLRAVAEDACRVFLLRHGQAMLVEDGGQVWSHHPVGLTPLGREQAGRAGRQLADVTLAAVYASDLERAIETAACVAAPHGLTPVIDASLREVGLGEYEGMTLAGVREGGDDRFLPWLDVTFNQRFPSESFHHPADLAFPGGESIETVHDRARSRFGQIAAEHAGQTIALVSHTWVIQPLLAHLTGADLRRYYAFGLRYATLTLATAGGDGRGTLVALNADLGLDEVAGGRLSRLKEE